MKKLMRYFGYISKNDVFIEALKWNAELLKTALVIMQEEDGIIGNKEKWEEVKTAIKQAEIILKFGKRIDEL